MLTINTSHRLAAQCDADRFGYDHLVGDFASTAEWLVVWYEQRNHLGNADLLDDAQDIHHLGEQQRRFASATVNITVNDEAPDISYNPDWFVLTNNTAMSSPLHRPIQVVRFHLAFLIQMAMLGNQSIAIDSNGFKHISYYDATLSGGRTSCATDTSGSWVVTTVDSAGVVGNTRPLRLIPTMWSTFPTMMD